jgi:hypothetical protein
LTDKGLGPWKEEQKVIKILGSPVAARDAKIIVESNPTGDQSKRTTQ